MVTIQEFDESDRLLSTYTSSEGKVHYIKQEDVRDYGVHKKADRWSSIVRTGLDVFLPAGYPNSVTEDYLLYKTYDVLQNLVSTIAGLLASRAVLQGVGVGDATATATGALLLSVFQDSAGRIATILFAHRLGSSIEPECKRYRLAADVFNDTAMIADCLSPMLPRPLRVIVLCTASIMRALCGVAAGSSKATLTAHFAVAGNLGELNAKDASQGNAISLLGMLLGSLVVSYITSPMLTWTIMSFLLTAHLSLNYAAVRCVSMRSLNRQRANILFSNLLAHDKVLTPRMVSREESIFEPDGALRWDAHVIGRARMGASLYEVARGLASASKPLRMKSAVVKAVDLERLLGVFQNEDYIMWFDTRTSSALIVLKKGASSIAKLQAWCHALCIAHEASQHTEKAVAAKSILEMTAASLDIAKKLLEKRKQNLMDAGWLLDIASLEVKSGVRLVCMD